MSVSIKLGIFAGETIEHACAEAVRVADMLRVVAQFDFNGVNVMAKPGVCPKSLAAAWLVELRSERTIKIACVHPLAAQAKERGCE